MDPSLWYIDAWKHGQHFAYIIFLKEVLYIRIDISLRFVSKCVIFRKAALVQTVAWHQTCDMLLPELVMTQFTDV